jgi:predicted nucleic acid-binding protein
LIDSWAWVEYFRGSEAGERAREFIEGEEEAVVSTINLAEVYRWILRFYPDEVAEEKVRAMKQRCMVLEVTEGIAIESAKLKHRLRLRLGDAIILATARATKARIVTGDPDFGDIEDVVFIGVED